MKTIRCTAFLVLLSFKLFGQDSLWKEKKINEILTLKLPSKYDSFSSSFIKAYGGYINRNYFGFQFYDTIFNYIETEKRFQIALSGFIEGRRTDTALKKYSASMIGGSFGKTKGVVAEFQAKDSSVVYKRIYYYVTIANSKFYWFYAYCECNEDDPEEIENFFQSINFNEEKVNETKFSIPSFHQNK